MPQGRCRDGRRRKGVPVAVKGMPVGKSVPVKERRKGKQRGSFGGANVCKSSRGMACSLLWRLETLRFRVIYEGGFGVSAARSVDEGTPYVIIMDRSSFESMRTRAEADVAKATTGWLLAGISKPGWSD
ncbi:hypothetical protein QJS10_CPA16g00170 [Acorus calamus]|uniref:Uncharacterized protein n=1 Tax=Acorus calamus TaxID=4465 RepID=A0AAV9D3X2_ACOCL|nr:hypothetical protein QJS10_CPA16g00170 [Acorus calamus]